MDGELVFKGYRASAGEKEKVLRRTDGGDGRTKCESASGHRTVHLKMLKMVTVLVAQPCPTLCDHMDCGPPGFSVQGIL